MKRVGVLLALAGLALAALPAPVAAAGPDCSYAEVKLYTHYYQSGLQGTDCSDSADHAYDVNFGDSLDAFRTVDNNDTDSWEVWVKSTVAHCLVFYDSSAGGSPNYAINLFAGTTHAWGNLPSSWINRASRYSLVVATGGC